MVQVYLRSYTRTADGLFNLVEITMGSLLWALYKALGATTWSEEFLYFAASAIAINCGVFLLASAFSLPTALVMPRLFYYSMFHLTAAVCYLVGGVGSLRNASIIDGVSASTSINTWRSAEQKGLSQAVDDRSSEIALQDAVAREHTASDSMGEGARTLP